MATIGIDLTPIQGPHRMRGVGSVVINVMRHLSDKDRKKHKLVLFLYEQGKEAALDLVKADLLQDYEVRIVKPAPSQPPNLKTKAGLLHLPVRLRNALADHRLGSKRITIVDDLDVFLQFEQDILPPRGVKSVVIAYDLIPYILESDYLWNYDTARHKHHYSRRGALKAQLKRSLYLKKVKTAMNRSEKIIAISNHTKQDFLKYLEVPRDKIDVVYLGVSEYTTPKHAKPTSVERYLNSSWGDINVKIALPDTPFLLFVGGADPRRKLADLVHAFNLLRAQGNDLHLVLAGDTMLGPNSIPNAEAKHALLSSSYLDDIYMLGFVEELTREWLYQNATAFVYPSTYEGFGLPVLEALRYRTPVITYDNSSIREIAGEKVSYAAGYKGIAAAAKELLISLNTKETSHNEKLNISDEFSWSKTSKTIMRLTEG